MTRKQMPLNVAVFPAGPDVSTLTCADHGTGWEVVCETSHPDGSPAYDMWFLNEAKESNLTLEQAAVFLLRQYSKAKRQRVLSDAMRLTGQSRATVERRLQSNADYQKLKAAAR